MPHEVRTKEQIQALLNDATEVRVSKNGDSAKLKVRTSERLHTFKTTAEEADTMVKGLKVPVVEY